MHDRGEEYYLHYDFWPSVPYIHHVKHKEYFTDLVVEKELEVQNEDCEKIEYDYFGRYLNCVRFVTFTFYKMDFANTLFIHLYIEDFLFRLLTELIQRRN